MSFSVTLVGANGRMGAMFRDAWSATRPVFVCNRTADANGVKTYREEDILATVPRGDVVMLCVPAPAMPEALKAVAPHLHAGQILTDVCSVKVNPMRWMEESFPGTVVGTHPLFGPENDLTDARVALVRGKDATDEATERVAFLFREIGCLCFETTATEHDRAAGISQSLHFALAAAYFATAARHKDMAHYVTPSFTRWKNAAQNELTRNAAMFGEFTRENPLFPEVLEELVAVLRTAGPDGLDALVADARVWYEGEGKAQPLPATVRE